MEEFSKEYEVAFDQVRATEALLQRVTNEREMRRLKIEHQSRLHHMYAYREMYEKHLSEARQWSEFLNFFLDQMNLFFPRFFQQHQAKKHPF